jgi:hypothetical protein
MAHKQFNREEELESNRKTAQKIAGSHSSGWKTCIIESRHSGKKKPWGLGIIFLPIEKAIAGFVNQCDDGTTQTVIEVY